MASRPYVTLSLQSDLFDHMFDQLSQQVSR